MDQENTYFRLENQDLSDVTLASKDNIENKKKCKYYDNEYCKFKNECKFFHPSSECKSTCTQRKTCTKRHRRLCKYKDKCYFKLSNKCEFLHVTLTRDDKDHIEAHMLILIQMQITFY